jgi:hypothetical protein
MPKIGHVHTIRLPLRKICSALPAVVLISGGIMLPASASPGGAANLGAASESSRAIVVPNIAMTMPGSAQTEADPFPMPPPKGRLAAPAAPALQPLVSMLPAGTVPGSSSPVTLDSAGIPVRALEAYRVAATLVGSADPGCHIDWALLGAIGRVESDHARFGGNQLDSSGVARPGIIGIALDGSHGTARILDTDHGRLDRDTVYDRAVGPMQFIPGTWKVAGVDANGDGVKDPQNMADAAAATAVYLCSGGGDLSRPDDLRSAILRYNASDSYAGLVTAIANAYRLGVTALPASALTLAPSTAPAPAASRPASRPVHPAPRRPVSRQRALTPPPSATAAPTSAPAAPQPATTLTPPSATQLPSTTPPAPTSTPLPSTPTCAPTPTLTSSASPTPTLTSSASPTTAEPCAPEPCLTTTPPSTPCATPTSTG